MTLAQFRDLGLGVVLEVVVAGGGNSVALEVGVGDGRSIGTGQDGCTQRDNGSDLHG